MMTKRQKGIEDRCFSSHFAISPYLIFPGTLVDFKIYYRQGGNLVLYLKDQELYTDELKRRLVEGGIKDVYIRISERQRYSGYIERHLGDVLADERVPVQERARIFYNTSRDAVRDVFESCIGKTLDRDSLRKIMTIVKASIRLLSTDDGLRRISDLVSHDYKTFSHSLHVYTYSMAMLVRLGLEGDDLIDCGAGAMLHDIGKTAIPASILNKPDKLTEEEWDHVQRHPILGVTYVSQLPVGQACYHAILFHHERYAGGGYPTGTRGQDIPLVARVVTVCDVYDALTSERPYAPALKPFEALGLMKEKMTNHFDMELFKLLVHILSSAKLF